MVIVIDGVERAACDGVRAGAGASRRGGALVCTCCVGAGAGAAARTVMPAVMSGWTVQT
jgi:hypothetical protein